jgi:hypothetical protein
MRRQDIKTSKIVDYALRLNAGAVIRRLGPGTLSDRIGAGACRTETAPYENISYTGPDPAKEGSHLARRRLQHNIPADELKKVREA